MWWFHTKFSWICVCLCQGGRVLFEKQLIHTVAVLSWVFVERCHEMLTLGLKFFNGGDDNPERDPRHSTDTGQRRGKTEFVENTLKIWRYIRNTQYMNVHDILPIHTWITRYGWKYISQLYTGFVPFLTMQSWKVKVWHYDTLCFFCFEESFMMVRNEWHPLVRGTFKQISQVALKMKPFETSQHQAMTLNCTGRILHCTSDLVSWVGQWGGRGKIGMKVGAREMWHVTIEPCFTGFFSKFVTVRPGLPWRHSTVLVIATPICGT